MNMNKKASLFFLWLLFVVAVLAQSSSPVVSQLVLLTIETGKEEVILEENRHFEAPNWSERLLTCRYGLSPTSAHRKKNHDRYYIYWQTRYQYIPASLLL